MSVREYIGARYVPVFADPIQWDNTLSYEPLTVVTDNGTSYVSRQSVPPGTAIDNEQYWVRWADYNAQLEEYIRQVQTYSSSISALNDALPIADFDANDTVKDAIDGLAALLPGSAFDDEATVKDAIDGLAALLPGSAFDSVNTVDARFDAIEANGWVTTNRIADANVTTSKIADANVTTEKLASAIQSKLKSEQLILIGDSWFNPAVTSRHLREYVAQKLGISTVYNEAYGGSGFFAVAGHTFIDQANAIIANASIDKNRKTKIIVLGGTNDYGSTQSPTLYINAINAIYDAFADAFTDFEMQVFFMQGATNRYYPLGLIRDVQNGVTKCRVNNAAWPIPFNHFVDTLHLDTTGEQEFANYIASCFGIGKFEPRSVQQSLLNEFNQQLGNHFSAVNFRYTWTETALTVFVYITTTSNLNANTFNAYVDINAFVPLKQSAGNSIVRIPTLGGSGNITVSWVATGASVGIRNHDNINGATFAGSIVYVFN